MEFRHLQVEWDSSIEEFKFEREAGVSEALVNGPRQVRIEAVQHFDELLLQLCADASLCIKSIEAVRDSVNGVEDAASKDRS